MANSRSSHQESSTTAAFRVACVTGTLLTVMYLAAYWLIVEPYYISSGPARPRYDQKTSPGHYSAYDVRCEKLFRPAHWLDRNFVRREMWRKDSFEHDNDQAAAGRTR